MPDPTITTIDNASVALGDNEYRDETLQFPQADTYAEGTILARKDVSDTIAVAYTRQGSSTFTGAASSAKRKTLKVGDYVVTAGNLSSGVGQWTCADPDGNKEEFTTVANTDDLFFAGFGLEVAIADPGGGTEFDTGDVITCTVAADGDVVIYDPDGTGGAQTPMAVLPYEKTVGVQSDVAARPIVSGKVNADRLVIDDGTTFAAAHADLLRQAGIIAVSVTQLSKLDPGAS